MYRYRILTIWLLMLIALLARNGEAQTPARRLPKLAAPKIEETAYWTPARRAEMVAERTNGWEKGKVIKIWRGDPDRKEVALTFDDGPHPAFTVRLLDLLQGLNVHATFFLVGKKVDEAPGLLKRMVHEGHEVANHTYHHINLDHGPDALVISEIQQGNAAIRRACGVQPTAFRPPGGHHKDIVLRNAAKLQMRTILWTDDPADFANPGASILEARMEHVSNGAVILLHDGIEQTLDILPDLIARLRQDGYQFVTVSEMAQHLEASGHTSH